MKKLLCSLFILIGSVSFAQDINGVWSDSSSTSFGNCYAIFSIQGDSIFMTHYIEFNGAPFVEHGEGIIKDNILKYHVVVTKQIPGWTTTAGDHVLQLSADGKTLRGTYSDNVGNKGPLVFKRAFPQQK
tara:strand:- start:1779 stop:2165 length:387 start_codon:yes stop_codon:yes gene_type:complete